MGFSPAQVDQMSMWEFIACVEGWNKAHGSSKPAPPSEDEFDDSMKRADRIFGTVH